MCCVLELFASPWITGGRVATETRLLLAMLPTKHSCAGTSNKDTTNNQTKYQNMMFPISLFVVHSIVVPELLELDEKVLRVIESDWLLLAPAQHKG